MEDDHKFVKTKDNIKNSKMEDDIQIFKNGRQP